MSRQLKSNYFVNSLNYSLANEDSEFEFNMLKEDELNVGAVASSGSRIISILAKKPKNLNLYDISKPQIEFCKFRLKAIEHLDYDSYIELFGLSGFFGLSPFSAPPKSSRNFKKILNNIKLDDELKEKVEELVELNDVSLSYLGKWEKTFYKISKMIFHTLGEKNIQFLSECRNLDEQRNLVNQFGFSIRLNLSLLLLGNANLFKSLLYKGDFPTKNDPRSFFSIYKSVFTHLLNNSFIRDNYFLNIVFFGKILFPSALPFEYRKELFEKAKSALKSTNISFFEGNLLENIPVADVKFDVLFLSDVPSYFSGDVEKNYLQDIKASLNQGGLIIPRYYLRTSEALMDGLEDVTDNYSKEIKEEKTAVYNIKVFRKA